MDYPILVIFAFVLTTCTISGVQFGSTLFFLIDRLLSIIDLHAAFLKLVRMTIGLEMLSFIPFVGKLLTGHDFRFDVDTSATQLDLFVGMIFLVSFGSMCYLTWEDDIRFMKPTTVRLLDEFFGSPAPRYRQPNFVFWGLTPVTIDEYSPWKPPAKSTTTLDGLFEVPPTPMPVLECAFAVPVPPSSWSVPAYACLPSLSATLLKRAASLSSAISSWITASKTRYLSAISDFMSKTATLSSSASLPTCCSLSDVSAADFDLTLLDDTDESQDFDVQETRRVFGMVLPVERWQPKTFTLADLEIDDGSYLRDALGMAYSESLECCYWPELDEYVERRSSERAGAWYTDEDEVRGWIFPGREDVPEFQSEPTIEESGWDLGDTTETVVVEMARILR